MKNLGSASAIAVMVLFGCTQVGEHASGASEAGQFQAELTQTTTLGQVRAHITKQLKELYGYTFCYGKNAGSNTAQVISGDTAYGLLKDQGYLDSSDSTILAILSALESQTGPMAVHVHVVFDDIDKKFVYVPDVNETSGSSGLLFPMADDPPVTVCVSCVEYSGEVAPCSCVGHVNQDCGENPVVSCTGECAYCANPNNVTYPNLDWAEGFCDQTAPFADTTSFPSIDPPEWI